MWAKLLLVICTFRSSTFLRKPLLLVYFENRMLKSTYYTSQLERSTPFHVLACRAYLRAYCCPICCPYCAHPWPSRAYCCPICCPMCAYCWPTAAQPFPNQDASSSGVLSDAVRSGKVVLSEYSALKGTTETGITGAGSITGDTSTGTCT